MTLSQEVYYMQQSTLKADGNLAADAAKQYYQGMSGLR